jgi:thioredoxin 1
MVKFEELINGEKPVLVDFYADWCGPCKMMTPILQELAGKIEDKGVIIKIDIDKNQQAAANYQVQSVPTLIIFKQGKIVWRQSGVVPINQLEQLVNQFA